MNFENISIWYWLLVILTGLMGGIIGSYWSRSRKQSGEEIEMLQNENEALKMQLQTFQNKETKTATPSNKKTSKISSETGFDAEAAKAAFKKKIKKNDLTLVEGIGPKIASLFHDEGIKTWKALSETSTVKCQEILTSAGKRYRIHDPASWPMQAKMAFKGQWKELAEWQIKHKSGKF